MCIFSKFYTFFSVSYLAGKLLRAIASAQPELNISEVDILCVEIAGLCHDLGHGPFSHMFDGIFISRIDPNSPWRHEQASADMFDFLVEKNKLRPFFEEFGVCEIDRTFIKEQITGAVSRLFLFIIAIPISIQKIPFMFRDSAL